MTVSWLTHNRIQLALHHLRDGDGRALLLLHGLGESSPTAVPASVAAWPGPIAALDFTGHGASTMPTGGGYTAELLMADADIALAALGRATLVGRGLGAYVALLVAGARSGQVDGVVLADGPGLSGGPSVATSQPIIHSPHVETPPDPHALVELGRDLRPPDYATTFARLAIEGQTHQEPIVVAAAFRPQWLSAVVSMPGVVCANGVAEALARFQPDM